MCSASLRERFRISPRSEGMRAIKNATSRDLESSLSAIAQFSDRLQRGDISRQERDYCNVELRKALRSAIWEAEDYNHTLLAIEHRSRQYSLSNDDIAIRRAFIVSSLTYIQEVREHLIADSVDAPIKRPFRAAVLMTSSSSGYRYSRLNEDDLEAGPSTTGTGNRFEDILLKQEQIIREQDDDLELVGQSVSTLKHMSYKIGDELEQQSSMLDDLGHQMERVDARLDGVMKKMAKLTHLEDDQRQWKMIIILSILLFFLVFLLIVL